MTSAQDSPPGSGDPAGGPSSGGTRAALITGAASGFGAAVARRLHADGVRITVADVDEPAGRAVAEAVDGIFVRCDVRDPEASVAAVAATEQAYGRLDIAFLN